MEDNQVKKLPAFDHIKVLQGGNYGCTLCAGNKIYNGVFTPNWECVEKLHLVEVDAYSEYDYTLIDKLNSIYKEDIVDEEFAKMLTLNYEEDNSDDSDFLPQVLFLYKYQNADGDIALTIDNTLISYKFFILTLIENIFNKLYECGCNKKFNSCKLCWDRVEETFGISLISNEHPFAIAIKSIYKEYQTFDDIAVEIVKEKYPDASELDWDYDLHLFDELDILEEGLRDRLYDGAYDLCPNVYMFYVKDNCKDIFDGGFKD